MSDKEPKTPTTTKAPSAPEKPDTLEMEHLAKEVRLKLPTSEHQSSPDVQISQIFKGETMTSKEISPELITEISDYYLWLFRNTMHFAVCPPCEGEGLKARLTARKVFGAKKDFVPSSQMDNIQKMPSCPCCENDMQLIYDPETLKNNFRQKLMESDESFTSLLRREDGSMAGLGFAYITNLMRELSLEWQSKYPYMKPDLQKPEYQRSKKRFLACVEQVYGETFNGDETVFAWNCMSISPDAKGGLPLLMRNLFARITPEQRRLKAFGDVERGSPAHAIFRTIGVNDGTLFFDPEEKDILVGGRIGEIQDTFNLSPEEFRKKRVRTLAGTPAEEARAGIKGALKEEIINSEPPESPEPSPEGNPEDWDTYAKEYEELTITNSPARRRKIIESINDGENILIVGAGSPTHLQEHLLSERDVKITAGDFSKDMLRLSARNFQHPNLKHRQCDTRNLPPEFDENFDVIISTNSVVPPSRHEVIEMYTSIYRSLNEGGQFIAYLPSFTLCVETLERHPELRDVWNDRMDHAEFRLFDPPGWQCFHTEALIRAELQKAGFAKTDISIEKTYCEDEPEARYLTEKYEIDSLKDEYWCFFVKVKKHTDGHEASS